MPEFKFFSIEEVKEFVGQLKGGRRTKDKDDSDGDTGAGVQTGQVGGQAPPPLQPPAGNMPMAPGGGAQAFQPGSGPAFTPPGGAAPSPMAAIVGRIVTQVDNLIAGRVQGQPAQPEAAVLDWLRKQIAPHDATAANATMDQVKQVYLNKLPEPALNEIARLIGA